MKSVLRYMAIRNHSITIRIMICIMKILCEKLRSILVCYQLLKTSMDSCNCLINNNQESSQQGWAVETTPGFNQRF